MRSPVAVLSVTDTPERVAALELAAGDVGDAGGVQTLDYRRGRRPRRRPR